MGNGRPLLTIPVNATMGDKKSFTDEEFRRLKRMLQAYISTSEWDERMNIKRERWLWERSKKQSQTKIRRNL